MARGRHDGFGLEVRDDPGRVGSRWGHLETEQVAHLGLVVGDDHVIALGDEEDIAVVAELGEVVEGAWAVVVYEVEGKSAYDGGGDVEFDVDYILRVGYWGGTENGVDKAIEFNRCLFVFRGIRRVSGHDVEGSGRGNGREGRESESGFHDCRCGRSHKSRRKKQSTSVGMNARAEKSKKI